ncbi:MAG: hypothetical protein NT098_00695 [Candidatus Parcubacteria bacterium]|nr:hypothetical protein [Candidatus Parcubacteria bacterium]
MKNNYEYEERAFLTEEDFFKVKKVLESMAVSIKLDNKVSYFFVLPEQNLSVAKSEEKCIIKYKHGAIGAGNGFTEYEIPVDGQYCDQIVSMFSLLFGIKPQTSEQFRINYVLPNGVEIALKYTQTWGFHLELEKTYSNEEDKSLAKKEVEETADELKIHRITDAEMKEFRDNFDAGGVPEGEYTSEQFREKFRSYFVTR